MAILNHTMTSHDRPLADIVRVLGHPDDVLTHPDLTTAEKREVLAAWASDAHCVVDAPALRQLDSGAIVSVDEVLRALQSLDKSSASYTSTGPTPRIKRRRPSLSRVFVSLTRRDDDDDPPQRRLSLSTWRPRAVAKWEPTDTAEPVAA